MDLVSLLLLPIGLGLLGFVEPCSIGASLFFLRQLEGRDRTSIATQTIVFVATRTVVIGLLGAAAALIGTAFADVQRFAWIGLGALFVAIGALYLSGRADRLMVSLGPGLGRWSEGRYGALGLGVLFGLNIPACAAPLLFGALGVAAVGATAPLAGAAQGFLMLGLFGLALSAPLALLVWWPPAHRLLERALAWSGRVPWIIGGVFVAVGLWSIWFGLYVSPEG